MRDFTPLRGGSIPPGGQSEAGVPYSGVAPIPLHAVLASGWQPQSGTTPLRAQRVLKGKWVIDKREKTAGCLPLARSAAAQAAFPPAMRGHRRCAFQGEYLWNGAPRSWPRPASLGPAVQFTFSAPYGVVSPRPRGRAADLTGPLRLAAGAAIHLPSKGRQDGWCRCVGRSRARAGFFAPLRFAQNDK